MSRFIGQGGPWLVDVERVYEPREGDSIRETWKGTTDQLRSLQTIYNLSGCRTSFSKAAGRPVLYVTKGGGEDLGQTETPSEEWSIDTEFVEESLWTNRKIHALAGGSDDTIAEWRREIENALKGYEEGSDGTWSSKLEGNTGPLTPTETGFTTNELNIYKLMVRGATAFETERAVVSRTRTYGIQWVSGRMTISDVPIVYEPLTFYSTFNVPGAVRAQLPDTTSLTVPENTKWAWKVRSQNQKITYNGKVEETMSWTLAAWSTLLYTVL